MITEDTRIDHERITADDVPSVSDCLRQVYGVDLCGASAEECLVLLAVAYSLRHGGAFSDNLCGVVGESLDMPWGIYTPAGVGRNEELKLLTVLQVAIVEKYSVES